MLFSVEYRLYNISNAIETFGHYLGNVDLLEMNFSSNMNGDINTNTTTQELSMIIPILFSE